MQLGLRIKHYFTGNWLLDVGAALPSGATP